MLCAVAAGAVYGLRLDSVIRTRFEGRRWALPGRVYARPLELYAGARLTAREFARELEILGYRPDPTLEHPGSFDRHGDRFELHTRAFGFWDGEEPGRRLRVSLADGDIRSVRDLGKGEAVGVARLDPPQIGSFYPDHFHIFIVNKGMEQTHCIGSAPDTGHQDIRQAVAEL